MRKSSATWKIYRTRFLIKARQLSQPLIFVDALGREHRGHTGDYLVESSDGSHRVAPRMIFEDVYVPMGPALDTEDGRLARPGYSALPRAAHVAPDASSGTPNQAQILATVENRFNR